ncbi:MAG: hypothetical protein KAJ51_15395, partial [Thermoplasmata archaeon]|nr:hypothetical protein [Thermoplasmata archaeon]
TVTGNVTDELGNPLYNVSVNIHVSSKTPEANVGSGKTKSNGEFEITCFISNIATDIEVGENYLLGRAVELSTSTVIFKESWTDNNSAQEDTTVFVHLPTVLKFINPERQVPQGYKLTVQGKLMDISSLPLAGYNVSLLFDGATWRSKTTNETGIVVFQYKITEAIGSYDVSLFFESEQFLHKSTTNYTLFVRSDEINISISLDREEVTVNEFLWVNGTIIGINNETLSTRINITFNPVGTLDKYVIPFQSENGIFNAKVFIHTREFRAGKYDVYVYFPGTTIYSFDDSNYEPLSVIGLVNFKMEELIVYRGSAEISVRCNMTDHQGIGLAGRYVIIEYTLPSLEGRWPNGTYSVRKTTGHGGKFTFPFTAELTDPLGAVSVTFIYDPINTKFYKNASIEKQIYIKSPTVIILEDFPNKMVRNQGYLIKGYILDDQNKGVVSERLNVYLGGDENFWQIYSVTTETDGNFTLSILVPTSFPLGVHPVELNLGLNDRYEGLTISENTEIFSEPLIMLRANGTITKGKDFIISLTLTEDNGKVPISKSIVKLFVNDIQITQVITDEDGYA